MLIPRYSIFHCLSSSRFLCLTFSFALWAIGSQMGWCSVPFNSRTLVSLPNALVTGTLPNGLRYMLLPNAHGGLLGAKWNEIWARHQRNDGV